MDDLILNILSESLSVKEHAVRDNLENIKTSVQHLVGCIADGRKVLIFGNGGSAADAQHIAAEFVNRFMIERPPLAAIALTTDSSILTSIGNDYDFDDIFSKQIQALGKKGDIAWGISTSGNSPNVLKGLQTARERNLYTIGLGGRGGKMVSLVDIALTVPSDTTARIQESHLTMAHIMCELVERTLYPQHFK
jgi:D-sedoheptulose 7-phosphate isomerase